MKAQVVQEIRSNQQLEQDLDVMDIKIGLLVKNRITLQDVVSHSQQVKSKDKKNQRHSQILEQGSGVGVGGLSKANHEKLEVKILHSLMSWLYLGFGWSWGLEWGGGGGGRRRRGVLKYSLSLRLISTCSIFFKQTQPTLQSSSLRCHRTGLTDSWRTSF